MITVKLMHLIKLLFVPQHVPATCVYNVSLCMECLFLHDIMTYLGAYITPDDHTHMLKTTLKSWKNIIRIIT